MKINLKLITTLCFFVIFFMILLIANYARSVGGQPGDRCETKTDCRPDLDCFYNVCLAKPFTPCTSWEDCAGSATHLMGCFDKGDGYKCYGRHAYPCGDQRNDPVCAPNFHCDISNPNYHYCEGDDEPPIIKPPTVITIPAVLTF